MVCKSRLFQSPSQNIMLNKNKTKDKTLSNKRRSCSGEHLLHEEVFLNGHRTSECNGLKQLKILDSECIASTRFILSIRTIINS